MIRVELLPAAFGDCILIEYGSACDMHRILVDAGLTGAYASALKPRLARIAKVVSLDLLVATHIDRDHICGILPLMRAGPAVIAPKEVWFNGRHHLEDDQLGAKDGEVLGDVLAKQRLPWNTAFDKRAVVVPDQGDLPVRSVGDATLTLLSPYRDSLRALADEWDDTLGHWDEEPADVPGAAMEPDDILGRRPPLQSIDVGMVRDLTEVAFVEDGKTPNGSSIAFLFEFERKRILFGADAHPAHLVTSLDRISAQPVKLDALKLSHHGSMNNLSPELLAKVNCSRFLVSSNGGTYGHPHPETMARIVTGSPERKTLCFNYSTPYTTIWDDNTVKAQFKYDVAYPNDPNSGFVLEL